MRLLLIVLALAGVVVSALALQVHYSTGIEPCSINEHWDCGVVNHSPFAEIHHVPVAILGILGYLLIGALAFARRRALLLVAAVIGLAFALHLTWIEKNVLMVYCLYCVISQIVIALITLLSIAWLASALMRKRRARSAV